MDKIKIWSAADGSLTSLFWNFENAMFPAKNRFKLLSYGKFGLFILDLERKQLAKG